LYVYTGSPVVALPGTSQIHGRGTHGLKTEANNWLETVLYCDNSTKIDGRQYFDMQKVM